MLGVIIVIVIVLGVLLSALAMYAETKCDACKKNGALVEQNRVEIRREKCSKMEEHRTRNAKGEVTGSREVRVYGTKITYSVTYRCKYCGYECQKVKHEEKY